MPPLPPATGSAAPDAAVPPSCAGRPLLPLPAVPSVLPEGVEEARARGAATALGPPLPPLLPRPRTAAWGLRGASTAAAAAAAAAAGIPDDGGVALAGCGPGAPAPPSWDTRTLLWGLLWALQGRGASANWQ